MPLLPCYFQGIWVTISFTLNKLTIKRQVPTMINSLKTGFMLILTVLILASCTSPNPYGDPGAQRDRSKEAQDEMRRDTR